MEQDDAFESLYATHADRLWRALYVYGGDRDVASDAMAEAFTQLLHRGSEVRSPSRWLWRAAFRIAAGDLKARRMTEHLPTDFDLASPPTGELLPALRVLPLKQRAVLVLHYYAGYKAREIGDILGSTAATVRVHLSQGRKRLRTLLEEDDD